MCCAILKIWRSYLWTSSSYAATSPALTRSTRATSGCCSSCPATDWMVDMGTGCKIGAKLPGKKPLRSNVWLRTVATRCGPVKDECKGRRGEAPNLNPTTVWLRKWFLFCSRCVQRGIKWNYARFSLPFGFSPLRGSRCGSVCAACNGVAACTAVFWLVRCAVLHTSGNCAFDSKDNGSGGNHKAIGPEAQAGGAFIEPLIEPCVESHFKPRIKIGAYRADQAGICRLKRAAPDGPATCLASDAGG